MRVNFTRKRVIFTRLRVDFFRYVCVFACRFAIYYCVSFRVLKHLLKKM
jgi:hypothetical protein